MQIKTLNWLVVLLAAALLGGCGKPDRFADGWERGGNLHDVSLREWAFATDANRLASTADFVREYLPDLPAEALPLSSALIEECLTESSHAAPADSIKVRSSIKSCIDYAQQKAKWLSQEYAKKQALTN
ncbi:hypothetical protein NUH87_28880 [Pseudomonas batumici]|uniref:hypothetical protein n=1 Tax=Pseudomonas batumici TaxID=226910 RepID=UPI0030CE1083